VQLKFLTDKEEKEAKRLELLESHEEKIKRRVDEQIL
jgi:hypothetical protein